MKILLDECIPIGLQDHLMKKGCEVVHVKRTEWAGFNNSDLYKKAQNAFQIFITTDRHFSHSEKFKPIDGFGVLYLRVAPTTGPLLMAALDHFLSKARFEDIVGKLAIVRREDFEIR